MDLWFLKKIRVAVSLIFLFSITALFLDLSFSIQSDFSDYPLYLQFIPSLLNFISFGTIAGLGFLFIIILTVLFGRIYCSTVCPLGILQDTIIYLRKRYKTISFALSKPFSKTRYTILIVTIVLFLAGNSFALNLLDPFSNFGRIITNIVRPILIVFNNITAFFLESINYYFLSPLDFKGVNTFSLVFSISIFTLIIWFSFKHGRLFCNSICPVGTLLGFISKFSFFNIKIIESNCIECGDCETVCKSNCIESNSKHIDFSRCVGCFNCFDICPSIGISYKSRYQFSSQKSHDISKRSFFKNIGIFLIGSNLLTKAQKKKIEIYILNKIPVIRSVPVSPPGSLSIKNLNDNCTACHLCVASCPTQVLQPSFLEYGLLEIMQPRMNYKTGFCNYDCTVCTEVCPSGAIVSTKQELKKLIQLGKAKFVKDNCVVYTQKTDCGACAEHCPTKAVKMEPDIEVNLKAPKITDEICVGCGACEFACPTIPYKAIYIEGNLIHQKAKKPDGEKIDTKIDYKEEFPF